MTESSLDTEPIDLSERDGVCVQIKNTALKVIDRLGATVGILEDTLEEVCENNCSVCPVQLRREGQRVAMNVAQTSIYGITTGWENLVEAVKPKCQDS